MQFTSKKTSLIVPLISHGCLHIDIILLYPVVKTLQEYLFFNILPKTEINTLN